MNKKLNELIERIRQGGTVTAQEINSLCTVIELMNDKLITLRNGGCGRERNQHFANQNYKENCTCCNTVRENIDNFFTQS